MRFLTKVSQPSCFPSPNHHGADELFRARCNTTGKLFYCQAKVAAHIQGGDRGQQGRLDVGVMEDENAAQAPDFKKGSQKSNEVEVYSLTRQAPLRKGVSEYGKEQAA